MCCVSQDQKEGYGNSQGAKYGREDQAEVVKGKVAP
jgi:hypothetical protein